jgi:hypothetical protein
MGTPTMQTSYVKFIPVVLAGLVAAGCSRGPDLVDRTQPNYIQKADLLDGTWYIRDTVVGVPPTSAITFEGYQGDVDKVRFEVQENFLVAYRTYEWFPGSDAKVDQKNSRIGNVVTTEGKPYKGAPVGAWRITSHFDRIREYNPATGEQSNVLVENSTDRPWYERDYMRVDWGRNSVTNWNALGPTSLAGWSGRPGDFNTWVQPIDQEPGDDALVMDYAEQDGKQRLNYFDFTVRQFWDAPTYNYPGYGEIPYCWLAPTMDCRGAVIKVRTSVLRVDEKRVADYEPLRYDDSMMKKFGLFRNGWGGYGEGVTYDRNQGATLSGRLLMAKRHNIWQRAHDEEGKKLPVTERQPRPVVYHLSESYPKDLMESARGLETSWDNAFRKAVAVPRGLEIAQVPQMFYICENPVPAGAPAACGKEGLLVRPGDIRYHMLNWVDHPQMAGPLGYGPSGADPETGEIIQAVANMYGAGVDTFAGYTVQILDVLTGELSIDDLVAGNDVRSFLAENRKPTDPRKENGPAQSKSGLTSDATQKSGSFARITGDLQSRMATHVAGKKGLPKATQNKRAVTAALIAQNPMLEDTLVNLPEIRAAVLAAAPGEIWRQKLQSDPAFYRQVARDTMLRFDELNQIEEQRQLLAGMNSIWLAEFSDGAYIHMAKEMKAQFDAQVASYQSQGLSLAKARAQAKTDVWTKVRNAINRFVAEHEVGHTVGLTHNFIGSYDALNFRDEYWDLRKDTIGVIAGGERVFPLEPQDLVNASRRTEKQLNEGMQTHEYSTVMDYMARFPIHAHGIGKYDEAAILFAYSGGHEVGWVEVFNETRGDTDPNAWTDPNWKIPTTNMAKPMHVRGAHTEIPLAHVQHYTPYSTFYSDRFHYTTLPFHFADKNQPFEKALDQGIARIKNRSYRKYSELANTYKAIEVALHESNLRQDHNLILRMYDRSPEDYKRAASIVEFAAKGKPVEVPYLYCSDRERGANLACNVWDSGADVYEMTRDWINRYNEYYVFSNFRRDRLNFSPSGVFRGKYGRFTSNLPNVYHQWLFNIYWYQDGYNMTTEQMHEWFGGPDPIYQNYWTMAVIDGVNHLMAEMSQPAAGYFGKDASSGRWHHLAENNSQNTRFNSGDEQGLRDTLTTGANPRYSEIAYLPRGPGRNMYTLFDNDGYDFWRRTNEVGHFWDQYGAMIALTESRTNFIGVDRGADATRFSLPYFMTFNKELSNLVSGVWLQDGTRYSSGLLRTGDGLASSRLPNLVRAENYVAGFQYPPKAEIPPVNGGPMVNEPIEPTPSWTARYITQLFGMASFTDVFNQDFADQNKVFRLGSSENVTPAPGFEVVSFADPFGGGYSYAAMRKVGDPQPPAAAFQVQRAIELKADWDYKVQQAQASTNPADKAYWQEQAAEYEGKTRDAVRNLELMRGMYATFSQVNF